MKKPFSTSHNSSNNSRLTLAMPLHIKLKNNFQRQYKNYKLTRYKMGATNSTVVYLIFSLFISFDGIYPQLSPSATGLCIPKRYPIKTECSTFSSLICTANSTTKVWHVQFLIFTLFTASWFVFVKIRYNRYHVYNNLVCHLVRMREYLS